ncbi:hypothetical protein OSB04_031959 [Centaurea solstitialis]|uniref:Jasmonic acid-amido synthetase JAR1-like n=1 Tax=Centaurea solstitialis TaxID=347529 RepID=A0AA38W8L8_9ASTR|nr:hypothetical protein OSB04_031959 [Centaurea solstitialis]
MLEKIEKRFDPEEVIEEFERLTMDAKRVQIETLKKILKENGEAEYLKKWGLNGRIDPESYTCCVPLVTHKDLEPLIQQIADGAPHPILTGKPITTITLSSGTTQGKRKFVPFNDELTETTMQIYRTSFAFRNRAFPIGNGKALSFIYGSKQFKTKGGLLAGTATTNVYRSDQFKKTMKSMQTPCCSRMKNFELLWEELCSDIKTGTLSARITVPTIRTAMAEILKKPDPELADKIHEKCLGLSNWYGLIEALFPNANADYGSSEGWIGANVNPTRPPEMATFAVLPNIGYFEFIPLRETGVANQDPRGVESALIPVEPRPVGLIDVEIGEEYEVVVTNFAGLYRYRLGDVVKVVGFHNATPELQFVCRRNIMPTINIDKNTEKDLQFSVEAAAKLLADEKLEVVDFTSQVDLSSDPGHYVIFWEVSGEASEEVLKECCNCLDLAFVDAGYVSSRKVHAIGPLELRILKRGTFQKILDHYVGMGSTLNQFKTPRCVGPVNHIVLQILCNNVVKSYFSTAFN